MRHSTMLTTLAATFALVALAPGCKSYTSGLKAGGTTTAQAAPTGPAAGSWEEAMSLWQGRGTKEGLDKAIAAMEAYAATHPGEQEPMIALSRAWYFMGDAYVDEPEQRAVIFEKGVTWGEKAMAADLEFKARIDKGEKASTAVEALQKDDQMAIYWTGVNLGKWARLQGFSTVVKYKGYISALMTKCTALDETAFWGGPTRYWGSFYAVAPSFAGGDMTKSKEYFEKAKTAYPEVLTTYVLYADTYATKAQDRALFKSLLEHVIAAPGDAIPELVPEMANEKKKAEKLLARIDELFAS